MKPATIIICQKAVENALGTFDITGAGITNWEVESLPTTLEFSLLVRVPPLATGTYHGELRLEKPDGDEEVIPMPKVKIIGNETGYFVYPLQLHPNEFGIVTFRFKMGDVRGEERLIIKAKKAKAPLN